MIRDLDDSLKQFLTNQAAPGSLLQSADISFDLPDATWRGALTKLTVNLYLYDVRQNLQLRTNEPLIQRSPDGTRAIHRLAPARIDCAYCITAWSVANSDAVLEEHRLLSQVLLVLLRNPTIPAGDLVGSLTSQIPPYPTVVASQDGVKNQPEFWNALDQRLKPSLNYIVTLAMLLDDVPAQLPLVVDQLGLVVEHMDEKP